MLIKQDGNLRKRHYLQTIWYFSIFCHFWLIIYFFYWSWAIFFLANTCIFYILKFIIYNTMLHVFCKCLLCLLFMERFVCKLYAYVYLQYKEDTGRSKMCQEFWSFRGFRTKSIGLEYPSRIFPRYSPR